MPNENDKRYRKDLESQATFGKPYLPSGDRILQLEQTILLALSTTPDLSMSEEALEEQFQQEVAPTPEELHRAFNGIISILKASRLIEQQKLEVDGQIQLVYRLSNRAATQIQPNESFTVRHDQVYDDNPRIVTARQQQRETEAHDRAWPPIRYAKMLIDFTEARIQQLQIFINDKDIPDFERQRLQEQLSKAEKKLESEKQKYEELGGETAYNDFITQNPWLFYSE